MPARESADSGAKRLARLLTLRRIVALALLVLVVFSFVIYKVTTAAERARFVKKLQALNQRREMAWADFYWQHETFFESLRARTRLAPVTPLLLVVNTTMFLVVLLASLYEGRGALVEWGASIGPRTTNGEWWRLVTSMFLHLGPLHLVVCLIGFFPLAFVMERLFGSVALAIVYVASGVFAGLTAMSLSPLGVTAGATGAICGLYGLAFAAWVWRLTQKPRVTVPWGVIKWLGGAGFVFFGYNYATGIVPPAAQITGLLVGALSGMAIGRGVGAGTIPLRRCAAVATAAVGVAIFAAVPVHGITDVRPAIEHMIATDQQTAAVFRTAATQLALGRQSDKAMINLIERGILPKLEREQPNLAQQGFVPDDQQEMLAAAQEYLQVRVESWRLRADALRKGSLAMLHDADEKEGAARSILARHPSLSENR